MACISTASNGTRRILFVNHAGDRKTVRLGKASVRTAEEICRRVETMNAAAITGMALDGDTAAWLGKIGDALHTRLAAARLVTPRTPAGKSDVPALGAFLQTWLDKRAGAKPNSVKNYKLAVAKLNEFFQPATPIDAITPGQADDFARAMAGKHAKAWTWRLVKFARQFFHAAVRDKVIRENPFAGIMPPPQASESREFFVTRQAAQQVIDACPDAEWRLIFALARYGGLRCPSELLPLSWPDVDWERGRFLVHAPKTEHHDDGGERWVPIFPELLPHLEAAFDAAPEGSLHVIAKHRGTNANLRQHLGRIIRKAGLKPWPKLFINCRASRETELAERFPMHVVCAWIGNSERVAAKHYLQVTSEHFERAVQGGAQSDARGAQNQAQQASAPIRTVSQDSPEGVGVAGLCETLRLDASACNERNYTRQESNLQPMAP